MDLGEPFRREPADPEPADPEPDHRRRVGDAGEERAAEWYCVAGYRVVERNWRCAEGEIDLVCRRRGTIVVVEVKARTSGAYGSPAAAVSMAKQRRLRRLAARWLRERRVHCDVVRFDVVAVTPAGLEVLEDAF